MITCKLFVIILTQTLGHALLLLKNDTVNTAQMKKAFYSWCLVPKYNFTASRDRTQNIFFSSFLLFCYQKVWSNTKQETTEMISFHYRKKAWVSYHGNCLESIIMEIPNLLMKVYWLDADPLQPSSCNSLRRFGMFILSEKIKCILIVVLFQSDFVLFYYKKSELHLESL